MIYGKETLHVRVIKMDLSWWCHLLLHQTALTVWFLGLLAASLTIGITHPGPILFKVSPLYLEPFPRLKKSTNQ